MRKYAFLIILSLVVFGIIATAALASGDIHNVINRCGKAIASCHAGSSANSASEPSQCRVDKSTASNQTPPLELPAHIRAMEPNALIPVMELPVHIRVTEATATIQVTEATALITAIVPITIAAAIVDPAMAQAPGLNNRPRKTAVDKNRHWSDPAIQKTTRALAIGPFLLSCLTCFF